MLRLVMVLFLFMPILLLCIIPILTTLDFLVLDSQELCMVVSIRGLLMLTMVMVMLLLCMPHMEFVHMVFQELLDIPLVLPLLQGLLRV